MSRAYPDNIVWVCCCCGCLPLIGLLIGCFTIWPVTILITGGWTVVALALLPHDIVLSYRAVARTGAIGINLKIVGMFIVLPLCLILWPVFVCAGSIIVSVVLGLLSPMAMIFDEDYYGVQTVEYAWKFLKDFANFNYKSIFEALKELEDDRRDKPFDINILQLVVALFQVAVGSLVGVVLTLITGAIHVVPFIFWMWKELVSLYCDEGGRHYWRCILFPLLVVALLCVPIIAVCTYALYVLAGAFVGPMAAAMSWNNFGEGWAFVLTGPAELEGKWSGLMYDNDFESNGCLLRPCSGVTCACECACSCLSGHDEARDRRGEFGGAADDGPPAGGAAAPHAIAVAIDDLDTADYDRVLPMAGTYDGAAGGAGAAEPAEVGGAVAVPPPTALHRAVSHVWDESAKISRTWDNLFEQTVVHGKEMIDQGVLTTRDLEEREPFLYIGLPGLVILRCVLRSIYRRSRGLVLADGTEWTEDNRPKRWPATVVWQPTMKLKVAVHAAMPNRNELAWLEQFILLVGDGERIEVGHDIPEERKVELRRIAAQVQSLATETSRLPTFRRKFEESVATLEQYSASVDPAEDVAEWHCPRCTFINPGTSAACQMCEQRRD